MQHIKDAQVRILKKFLKVAAHTRYGTEHGFSNLENYADFASALPITTYSDYTHHIDAIKKGKPDILWPGIADRFAISAGTTGNPKEIPMTKDREQSDKAFLRQVGVSYFSKHPGKLLKMFGKQLTLPGQVHQAPGNPQLTYGEISGYLATFTPQFLLPFQLIPPDEAVAMSFDAKIERALEHSIHADVRLMVTLPSVGLRFFQMMLEKTGKDNMSEIWPNFQIFSSGGEPLSSYREHISKLFNGKGFHFVENYGSSEGYYSFNTDQDRNDMELVVNNNVFYEWIPNPSANRDELKLKKPIPTWEVEQGQRYGMVVTSDSGMWRYLINDVIEFTDIEKPRIRVAGRITDVQDSYGEAIEVYHVKETLEATVKKTGGVFSNYSLGVVLDSERDSPTHIWFIEWAEKPKDMQGFAELADKYLIGINRSYEIRRKGSAIARPRFYDLTKKAIESWQKEFFRVGAQTKIPRMIHDQDKCRELMKRCERSV